MPKAAGRDSGQEEKKRPAHSVRLYSGTASIEACAWEQEVDGRTQYNVTLSRTYKDGDDYKQTKSLWAQDVPFACLALQQVYLWIASQQQNSRE